MGFDLEKEVRLPKLYTDFVQKLGLALMEFHKLESVDVWGVTETRSGKNGWKKITFYYKENK